MQKLMRLNKQGLTLLSVNYGQILWLLILGIGGRLLPHMPNVTPILSISLFTGMNVPLWLAWSITSIILLLTDYCQAQILGYPALGWFTFFTSTGFLTISLVGSTVRSVARCPWMFIPGLSCGFWLWTNFGVWLISGLYQHTVKGLVICYLWGIPFLGWMVFGDLLWYGVIIISARVAEFGRRAGFRFQWGNL